MDKNEAEDLLKRYDTGNVSEQEKAIVETWYLAFRADEPMPEQSDESLDKQRQKSLASLIEYTGKVRLSRSYNLRRMAAAAAAVALVLSFGVYQYVSQDKENQQASIKKTVTPDLIPGSNKVMLTLSNGRKVMLTGSKNGQVANDAGIVINKIADGSVSYTPETSGEPNGGPLFNTATTPRGGQYQFILSDGTKVWLNAATTLKFPVAFDGDERNVELNGEAYFEVAHDRHRPFRVIANGQTVEVLGTHFNINSYTDENVLSTTLLEGSVKVLYKGNSKMIKPGEQARLKDGRLDIFKVNTDQAVAWKNGLFYFQDADIHEVMRQLSRWYDVDVKFEGNVPSRKFSGGISSNVKASEILDLLSFKKIHYKIRDRTIIITP